MENFSLLKNPKSEDEPQTLTTKPVLSPQQAKPTPQAPQPSAIACQPQLNFELSARFKNELAMSHLPEEYKAQGRVVAVQTANALNSEGIPAAVRILCRDISTRQQSLHQIDSLVALMRQRARKESGFDMKKLREAERAANAEHNRLMKSIEMYERLMRPIAPTLRISGQNFVQVNTEER